MICVLGLDPSTVRFGCGVVAADMTGPMVCLGYFTMRLRGDREFRLADIHRGVNELAEKHRPTHMAIESGFMHQNATTTQRLSEARGAALAVAGLNGLSCVELNPKTVKKWIAGHGNADKQAVARIVKQELAIAGTPDEDSTDALAVAMGMVFQWRHNQRMGVRS